MNARKWWLSILLIAVVLLSLSTAVFADAGGYTTQSFHTAVRVYKNHAYRVTETIQVHFTEPRHGIYRYVPVSGTFYRQVNGKAVAKRYHARVSDVSVDGKNYDTDTQNDSLVIQIGDADRTVTGDQTYVIHYTWDPGDDGIASFDDFYFNIIPHNWPTAIAAASFKVEMPKKFNPQKAHVYAGTYGSNEDLEAHTSGKTLTGTVYNLKANQGVTVNLRLPKNYYAGAWTKYDRVPVAMATACICLILGVVLFMIFSRDTKPVSPVAFYAPHNFDPAKTGTIVDGKAGKEEILAMLMYLAETGYLKIEQTARDNFTFIKLKDLPKGSDDYANLIMGTLFPGKTTRRTSAEAAGDFSAIISHAEGMIEGFFTNENRLFTRASQITSGIITALVFVVFSGLAAMLSYAATGTIGADFIFYFLLLGVLPAIVYLRLAHILKIRDGMTKKKFIGHTIACAIVAVIITFVAISLARLEMGMRMGPVYQCYLTAFTLAMLTAYAVRRTPRGNTWLGEVLGFKHFLLLAEKPRIEKLVDDNPDYFFDILPYAYVLGVTDAWAKHFEDMTLIAPQWYVPYDRYDVFDAIWFAHTMDRCMTDIAANMITIPESSGSGGFGDGFGGGGGFSGGGGGGGGGGSW